ncbi:threonine-phosphate decarboxylase [Amylibacter kogurei]|uniref:Aminotransferase n=1 Tax=Paramylibacter kogurei TaxID=1889778 RepID=A0A2G5K239_9RHOB|nr:threonine-phosphate decarboxylase [Amylibacter kogurei]PIB23189.1 threonine-phosphate decarboxylase [Amylibacter kogurei]
MTNKRDHGGGLDAAMAQFGGARDQWLDLSTGINPNPYPFGDIPMDCWTRLPDQSGDQALINAARKFWNIPKDADILASSGVSQIIAMLPQIVNGSNFHISKPTYNEHEAAFVHAGFSLQRSARNKVYVHPNNPDGVLHDINDQVLDSSDMIIIDESFCDVCADESLIKYASHPNVIILKGLGKFWGLAGLRLGFAIGHPDNIQKLRNLIGPWAVSGPAQFIGARALSDPNWAESTRYQLHNDAMRLDEIATQAGLAIIGGTDLFRLYKTKNAASFQKHLAQNYIWSRIFPYSNEWIRLGLPGQPNHWAQLNSAIGA